MIIVFSKAETAVAGIMGCTMAIALLISCCILDVEFPSDFAHSKPPEMPPDIGPAETENCKTLCLSLSSYLPFVFYNVGHCCSQL